MYKIVRVGIPIQTRYISKEFLHIVNEIKTNDRVIALTTVDYPENIMDNMDSISSPAGHRILNNNFSFKKYDGSLNCKCINTMGFVWFENTNGILRDVHSISQHIIDMLNNHYTQNSFDIVYMFTPGSPNYGDSITTYMSDVVDLRIVDTPSSMQISLEKMKTYVGDVQHIERKYIYEFIDRKRRFTQNQLAINKSIDGNRLNIFNCLSDNYNINDTPIMISFMRDVSNQLFDDDLFLVTTVGEEDTDLMILTINQAKELIDQFRFSSIPFTVGIISKGAIK